MVNNARNVHKLLQQDIESNTRVKSHTCSPPLIEIKLSEQKAGPGLAESHNAINGLFAAKQSPLIGVGRILNTLTVPCLHDKTSWASPAGGISQTCTPVP